MVPTADRQKATVLVRIGFKQLDPRILPDMGVKVTFLREDEAAAAPAAQPVTLVPKAAVKTDGSAVVRLRRAATTSSSGAPSRPAAPTATASKCSPASAPASASSCRRRRTLGRRQLVVVKQ